MNCRIEINKQEGAEVHNVKRFNLLSQAMKYWKENRFTLEGGYLLEYWEPRNGEEWYPILEIDPDKVDL